MPQSILYFPSISIPRGRWLNNALLYWDSVSSIVPNRDFAVSPLLSRLSHYGVYRPVYPRELFCSAQQDLFIDEVIERMSVFIRRYPHLQLVAHNREDWIKLALPFDFLHQDKVMYILEDFFRKNGVLYDRQEDGFYTMFRPAADLYLSILAKYMAKIADQDMVIGTDRPAHFLRLYPRLPKSGLPSTDELPPFELCFSIALDKALPSLNPDVPIETLLSFRETRHDELVHLQRVLAEFRTAVSTCASVPQLESEICSFRARWEQEVSDFARMLHESRINFIWGSLKTIAEISVPGLIETLARYFVGGIPSWLAAAVCGAAGLIGVGVSISNYRKDCSKIIRENPFAYLHFAQKNNLIQIDPNRCIH